MEKILRRIYLSPKLSLSLRLISHAAVLISVAAYVILTVDAFLSSALFGVKVLVAGAVPYVLVTVSRRIINAPRPYELYEFYEKCPKSKVGQSFPSRHVFSAFTVSILCFSLSPWLMAAVAAVGVALAVARVLLGMHFIRDVLAGALIGIVSGLVGLLVIM